jgi:ubiquinone/menaquinone biosynthesis C-methylase UbiE
VLDVGCGAGAALAPASRKAAAAVGVELSQKMAERARAAAPDAEVFVGDASQLDFDDGSFDVVVSAFTVFFMPDPTAALQEWRRVLAPGGRIVLSTWAASDPRWEFERQIRRRYAGELDQAVLQELGRGLTLLGRFDDAGKVAAELQQAGFGDVENAEHQIEFVFRSEQDFWDWNWSHGTRVFFEAAPEDLRSRYRTDLESAIEQVRDQRGFPRTYTAVFTRAQPSG